MELENIVGSEMIQPQTDEHSLFSYVDPSF